MDFEIFLQIDHYHKRLYYFFPVVFPAQSERLTTFPQEDSFLLPLKSVDMFAMFIFNKSSL